jgi:hypothetical protein
MATVNQALRRCTKCREEKPATLEFFYRQTWKANGQTVVGLHSECKVCSRKRTRTYYHDPKNKDRIKRHDKEYRRAWCAKIKDIVFRHYGGWICACCGETEPLFLTLDHINNDGNEFRKRIVSKKGYDRGAGSGGFTYAYLYRHNFPPGYQVLCSNCNHGKRMNKGVCPHKEKAQRLGR